MDWNQVEGNWTDWKRTRMAFTGRPKPNTRGFSCLNGRTTKAVDRQARAHCGRTVGHGRSNLSAAPLCF